MEKSDYDRATSLLKEIQEVMAANMDNTPMVVGDRVVPWDGSSFTDFDGNKAYIVNEPFCSIPYWVIISTTEKAIHPSYYENFIQDLLLVDPVTGIKTRTRKDMVKHV